MLHRDVVNELHDQNGLAYARPAEEANFATLQIGLDQIDDLNSGFKHFQRGGLIFKRRRRAVDRVMGVTHDGAKLINRFPKDIHHPAQGCPAHRNFNPLSEIVGLHPANHTLDRLHGDGAHAAFAEVLLDFRGDLQRLRYRVAFAGDANSVINGGEVARFELNVHDRSDDLYYVPHACVFLCHAAFS